jgi:hypothetical protein
MLAERSGDPECCATLFGAANRIVEASEIRCSARRRTRSTAPIATARGLPSARAFDRAYERGAQEAEDIVWELALASLN